MARALQLFEPATQGDSGTMSHAVYEVEEANGGFVAVRTRLGPSTVKISWRS